MRGTTVHIVPHTHWDREWYEPFQTFRLRLVRTWDDLLDVLAAEPGYRFTFDGQTAALEDYLEVRPDRREEIRSHVESGRLAVGPWVTLADEFLVSGETLLRDLSEGLARCEEFGGAMEIGYLPDMFGHTAQMPQILRLCGIDTAVVWRGVPSAVDRTFFDWAAPDGSTVRAAYLTIGYGNALALPLDPAALAERAHGIASDQESFGPPGHVLGMNGTDHWPPQRGLTAAVAAVAAVAAASSVAAGAAGTAREHVDVVLDTLPGFFAAALPALAGDDRPLPTVNGELRSGWRANVLMGVTSCRVDLKALAARAERLLERYAEPLGALAGGEWPGRLLGLAWQRLFWNAAHDSSCSCSVDATMHAVEDRYDEVVALAAGLRDEALGRLAGRVRDDRLGGNEAGILVWNPSPWARTARLEVDVPADASWAAAALEAPDGRRFACAPVTGAADVLLDTVMTAAQVKGLLPAISDRKLMDFYVNGVDAALVGDEVRITLTTDHLLRGDLDVEAAKAAVAALAEAHPDLAFRARVVRSSGLRALVDVEDVAPLGWVALRAVETAPVTAEDDVARGEGVLDDGRVRVEVAADGTFTLTDSVPGLSVAGLGRVEDGGDAGDTYNYSPPARDEVVSTPTRVEVATVESGPRRGRLRIRRTFDVPAALTADTAGRSADTLPLRVDTELTLRRGTGVLEVDVRIDNLARDHRLRLHLPLPGRVQDSAAGAAFAVVRRGLTTEGGPHEHPLPTWPARGFVDCAGPHGALAVLTEQVLEYEVVADGAEVAVTLLRAVGHLSRDWMEYRPNPAGPHVASPHAQCLGAQHVRLAVHLHGSGWEVDGVARLAEEFAHPCPSRPLGANPGGDLPPTADPLGLGAGTAHLSALYRRHGGIECRLVNLSPSGTTVTVTPDTAVVGPPGAPVGVVARPRPPPGAHPPGAPPRGPGGRAPVRNPAGAAGP